MTLCVVHATLGFEWSALQSPAPSQASAPSPGLRLGEEPDPNVAPQAGQQSKVRSLLIHLSLSSDEGCSVQRGLPQQ